jgi:hypothetical protein
VQVQPLPPGAPGPGVANRQGPLASSPGETFEGSGLRRTGGFGKEMKFTTEDTEITEEEQKLEFKIRIFFSVSSRKKFLNFLCVLCVSVVKNKGIK